LQAQLTPVTVLKVKDCEVIASRYHSGKSPLNFFPFKKYLLRFLHNFRLLLNKTLLTTGCNSWLVQVGAVNQPNKFNVKRPQLMTYRRFRIAPKKKLTEFMVSQDACLLTGFEMFY
jgi:large subunit ribosomal protein L3